MDLKETQEQERQIERERLAYEVGGLLYMPAIQENIVAKLTENKIPCLTSVAFCLEDTILDAALDEAEETLWRILHDLQGAAAGGTSLPHVFVRVRTPKHLRALLYRLASVRSVITGFILPKFDLENAAEYATLLNEAEEKGNFLYVMPILESRMIAALPTRHTCLARLKAILRDVHSHILNIRVGGNDLSNLYGIRCPIDRTIYDLGLVRDVLIDILNVFIQDYVVSGPVWNYFGEPGGAWADGLQHELVLDAVNGFTGKTAIHPAQLPYIYESLKVTETDFADAKEILGWQDGRLGVARSTDGKRMNEVKCHSTWARKIYQRSKIYGIRKV